MPQSVAWHKSQMRSRLVSVTFWLLFSCLVLCAVLLKPRNSKKEAANQFINRIARTFVALGECHAQNCAALFVVRRKFAASRRQT